MHSAEVMTLSAESIEQFRSSLIARGRSQQTVKAYSTDLRMFLLATETEVTRMEYEDLAMSWLTMNRRTVSPKTTSRRLTSLRSFAKWAGWGSVLGDYKRPEAAIAVPHPLPEGMAGVRTLINYASNERQRALIALCGMCGCRISEALQVRPQDFDLEKQLLTIHGKGDKKRVVPVSDEAWIILAPPIIRAYPTNALVVGLKDRQARKVVTALGKRAGLKRSISSHDLRATFGTAIYDATRDIRLVQVLLGHAHSSTTEIYVGVTLAKMREAVKL